MIHVQAIATRVTSAASLEDNIVDNSKINFQRDPPRETDGVSREQANSNRQPNAEREYRGI